MAAVLEFLGRRSVERILCLGDLVGFNADSNECIQMARRGAVECIAGNHDLISIGKLDFGRCSNKAIYALKRTRKDLTTDSREYLGSLQRSRIYENKFILVHGGLRDVQQYVNDAGAVRENLRYLRELYAAVSVCFFGHTHSPKLYEVTGDAIEERDTRSTIRLAPGRVYFINPGSVDASRKSDHKMAEFGIYDSSADTMEFHRLPYDHRAVEAKAVKGGYRIDPLSDLLSTLRKRLRSLTGGR